MSIEGDLTNFYRTILADAVDDLTTERDEAGAEAERRLAAVQSLLAKVDQLTTERDALHRELAALRAAVQEIHDSLDPEGGAHIGLRRLLRTALGD